MQLIRSNLRGKDSSDEFFRTLPQLYCVSFQGSESSTSDGILKVFEKAQNYQKYDLENVMSVVILDEIGLAEISRFNPLKVLHTLLEPGHQICPDIAVVGISNWALDAAKMNRAIHLSRPEMDETELYKTGMSICLSLRDQSEKQPQSTLPFLKKYSSHKALSVEIKTLLKEISRSYFMYNKQQTFRHFHGLRDYYSLIKCISRGALRQGTSKPTDEVILQGLRRNFGGLPAEIHETMMAAFQSCFEGSVQKGFEILDLIQDNIEDQHSRHLMLITSGDTVVSVLEDKIKELNRHHVVIFGSQFEDDLNDDYNYRILSRIILCMEQGYILILKDLENIYGSLYDMLNQNYTVVGNKKNCRIALGPYSNPMCHVHDDFKCIVLIEESKIDRTDPPFLNRFEKQQFRFTYLMDSSMKYVKCSLEEMIKQFCETRKQKFTDNEVFAVSGEDHISSLVLSSKKRLSMQEDLNELFLHCQKELLWITTPDAVFRLRNSLFWEQKAQTVKKMEKEFLELPIHDGLIHYLDTLDSRENDVESDETLKQTHTGYMIAVFTNSNIHTGLTYGERRVQVEKLGHIKSEKQLSKHVQQYFDSNTNLFVLHCDVFEDFNHILLAKSTIENCMRVNNKKERLCVKNICMIFHLSRQNSGVKPLTQLNFLSGWKMVMIDSLEKSEVTLSKLLTLTPLEVLERRPIIPHLKDILFWAFTRVQYTGLGHTAENVMELISSIRTCDKILSVFAQMVLNHLSVQEREIGHCKWQREVALNKHALCSASCFVFALEEYLLNLIRNPLCKIIFKLEELNALHSVFVNDNDKERFSLWKKMTLSKSFLEIKDIPDQSGPECYTCTSPRLNLKLPYSFVILTNIEKIHIDFANTMKRLQLTYELDDEVPTSILNGLITDYKDIIAQEVSEYTDMDYSQKENEYLNDFCLYISSSEKTCLTDAEKIRVLSWSLSLYGENSSIDFITFITQIHIINWTYRTAIVSILTVFSIVKEKIGVSIFDILELLEQYPHCFNDAEDKINTSSEDIDFDRSFESRKKLVEIICTNLIPTTTVVSKFSTIYSWQNCICRLLPFLCTISMEPESLHVLRFSYDFASLIDSLSTEHSLNILSTLGDHFDRSQCVLGTKDVFQLVLSHVRLLKSKENVSKKGMDRLLCTFLSRCFAANPEDYYMMKMVLETVIEDSALNKSLDYLGPILSFVVRMANNLQESIFVELLDISSDYLHENPLIDILDGCIVSLCNRNDGDLCLSSLLVDVLQEEIFSVNLIEEEIRSVQTGSDYVIATAFKAYKILKGFEGCSFKTVIAVAYLKSFMSAFSNVILKQDMKTNCTILFSSVDALLQIRDAENAFEQQRCQSVLLYFLKCLHEHRNIHQLEKLVLGLCDRLPALKSVQWNPEFPISMLLFNPVMQYELDRNTIFLAMQEIEQQKDSLFKQILQIATKDQNTMLSLNGVLANKFYLRLGLKEICDSERKTAADILRLVNQDFPNLQKQMIKLLTNSVDFIHPMFHINTEIKTPQIEIVSVLIHLLCLIGSKGSWGNLFFDVMVMPNETTSRYIPGRGSLIEIAEDIQPILCDCKVRFASKTRTCPNCHEIEGLCDKEGDDQQTDDNNKSVCKTSYISSDRLSPTSSRLIDFFINGCVMLAYTCGFADKTSICRFIDTSINEFEEDVLQRSLICEWNTIKNLLAVNDKDMCSLMHIIINRLKDIFTSSTYPMSCQTDGERSDFEKEFNMKIEQIVNERHRYILRTRRELYMKQNVNMISLECHLEEVSIIGGSNERYRILPDLFRMTMLPTKDNFLNFLFTGENCRNHPFLCMVMKNEDSLSMPRYIIPLLKWHQSTVSICRYKMRKVECKDKTIEMLLDMETDEARRCALKKHFEEFKDSWNELLKKHNSTLKTHLKEYGYVSLKSKIIDCIITGNESAILKILNGLVNIQNDFLDKCLSLATSSRSVHCIDFLSCDEGCSHVHSTLLWDLKSRDIVSFLWNDKFLRYSQCNTYLGEGKERNYDFQKIEMEIAHDLILGKPYIDIRSTIPRIVFVDDLFQNTIYLIKHVRDTIPQENLPSEMVKNILRMKETKYSQISELLTLLGMVLSVLKKTKGDPCMSVVEYVEKWKIFVTDSSASCKCLPEPADSVKICHIVNLYHCLEEINGASVLDSLESRYKQAIPSDGKLMLETVGQHSVKYLEVLGQAINVFIHRCLSTSENVIELEHMLFDYLDDEQLWPFGSFQNGCITVPAENQKPLKDVLCDNLCVKHIYETSQFIQDFIENHNIMAQRASSTAASYLTASSIAASYLTKSQSTASKSTRKSRSFARKDLGKT